MLVVLRVIRPEYPKIRSAVADSILMNALAKAESFQRENILEADDLRAKGHLPWWCCGAFPVTAVTPRGLPIA